MSSDVAGTDLAQAAAGAGGPVGLERALQTLADADLSRLAESVAGEQRRRALEAGDLDALTEAGFSAGFTDKGAAKMPWLVQGLLVCPGFRLDRSRTSHDCAFVKIGDEWVWESEHKVSDVIRRTTKAGKSLFTSITLVTAYDGLEVDLLASSTKMNVHELRSTTSFVVRGGRLELVSARTRSNAHTSR